MISLINQILIHLVFLVSCSGNTWAKEKLVLNYEYLLETNKENFFYYTNTYDHPILIKVIQSKEINLKIYSEGGAIEMDSPGHRGIPEFIILDKKGQSVSFLVAPEYLTDTGIKIQFKSVQLNKETLNAWSKINRTIISHTLGNVAEAAVVFNKLASEIKNTELKVVARYLAVASYFEIGNYDLSLKLVDLIINENNNSLLINASTFSLKARIMSIKGNKKDAIKYFEKAAGLFLKINYIDGYASSMNNIGLSYHLLGELNLAKSFYDKALDGYMKIKDKKAIANQYINIGGYHFMKGSNKEAQNYYKKAVFLSKELKDKGIEADALEMYAWLQQSEGNYIGLLAKWGKILETRTALKDEQGISRAYRLIGNSYLSYGNYAKSLQFLNKSLERAKKVSLTESYPVLLNSIAQAYFKIKDNASSEKFYQQALLYNKTVGNSFYSALDYIGLAKNNIHNAKSLKNNKYPKVLNEKLNKSMASIDTAIDIYNNSPNKINLGNAILVKAEIYFLLNDYKESRRLIDYSRNISKQFNDGSQSLEGNILLGKIFLAQKKYDAAIGQFKTAINESNNQRKRIINSMYRADFAANIKACRDLLVQTLIIQAGIKNDTQLIMEALIVSELGKAKSLNELTRSSKKGSENTNESKIKSLLSKIQTLYFLKSDLQTKPHFKETDIERINQDIQDALFKYDVLNELHGYKFNDQLFDKNRIFNLQNQIEKNSIIIALRLMEERSYIWLIQKDNIIVKELPKQNDIENNVNLLYDFFKNSRYGIKKYPSHVVSANDWIMENVFGEIPFNTINKLVISPHGRFSLLPTAGLLKSKKKLLSSVDISLTPSLMIIKPERKKEKNHSKIMVIANPQFNRKQLKPNDSLVSYRGNSFENLKYTADEAKHIVSIYGEDKVDVLLGRDTTKENVLAKIEGAYDLIHFATHGLVDSETPEMSGLVLSSNGIVEDNILTIGEITQLNIKSKVVVLSACETAVGESIREEGLIGLSYAFLAAGASEVYATLWKIGDRSTLNSIKNMYKISNKSVSLTINDPFWVKYEIL